MSACRSRSLNTPSGRPAQYPNSDKRCSASLMTTFVIRLRPGELAAFRLRWRPAGDVAWATNATSRIRVGAKYLTALLRRRGEHPVARLLIATEFSAN